MSKVLVVDDAPGVHEMMATLFATLNVDAVHATSATEALEIFKREQVDVVLTDVRMERIDGITFLRKLKKLDDDAVVIVMTAYDRKDDILAALKLGAFDFFIKPFSVNEFKDSLGRAFQERERRNTLSGGEDAESLALLRTQLETKRQELAERELALLDKAGPAAPSSASGQAPDGDREAALAAREKAVREGEAALTRAQAEMERKLLSIDEFASFEAGIPSGSTGAGASQAAGLQNDGSIDERLALLAEREAFLEQSENALFEKGQALQELETELEQLRDQLDQRGGAKAVGVAKEAAEEIKALKEELAEKGRDLERREKALKDHADLLAKRERQLSRSEALVRAREKYLEASESILFEKGD